MADSGRNSREGADSWTPGLLDSRALNGAGPGLRGAGPGPKGNPAPRYPPAGDSRSTLADGALDFRVRNGNGYDRPSMGTGMKTHPVGRCGLPEECRDGRRTGFLAASGVVDGEWKDKPRGELVPVG